MSRIDTALSEERVNALLQMISKENRKKCLRFKFKEDVLRTLYGELMVRHVLCRQFSFKNEDIELLRDEEGKPYVKGFPVHFNISHSGDFVVCAFSGQEIGIDIEQVKEIDLEIARRFFCESEYEDLLVQQVPDRLDYFYSLWTLKESYIKWLGTGLSTPLDSFCFKVVGDEINFSDYNKKMIPSFKQFFVEGYKLSVCSIDRDFPNEIEEICIEDMVICDE